MATNGLHCIIIKTHPACDDRAEQLAALWTRGGGETWVCIAGTQSWGRGRNGNAESVKPHESPGEGGNGYTAVGKGKREVTARVRCAVRCFITPFITYLWMLNWQLSSLRQLVISLVLEGGAPPQSFQSPNLPLGGAQHGSKDEVRFLSWISLLRFCSVVDNVMQDTSPWGTQEPVVLRLSEQRQFLCYVRQKPACVICRCVGQQCSFVHFNFSRFFHFFLRPLSVRWR